ncbi:MAG: glycosyltransferase [Chitinophagales bacterium]
MKRLICTVTNDLTYDQRMDRICTSLSQAGYDVTLVGFLKKRSIKTRDKAYKQIRLRVFFKKGKWFFLEYNFRLFWYLLFKGSDMYCGIDLDTLLPVYMVSFLKRKKCVYDAHEFYTELPEIVDRPAIKRIWVMVERFLLPRIKYNYTVSLSIAETLGARYQKKYGVIRNVPLLQDPPEEIVKGKYILYQGALNMGRGLEQLMQAMDAIDATLYIAGEGDLSVPLRAFAAGLPHAHKIRFLGYVRPDALRAYTYGAQIGVNLVENLGLSYYYSLSNKFFDYIHAGIPQVTMQFPEYEALNTLFNVAVLVPDLDPDHIRTAIQRLLQDEALYHSLAENTKEAKKHLHWQEEEKKLIHIYRSIV